MGSQTWVLGLLHDWLFLRFTPKPSLNLRKFQTFTGTKVLLFYFFFTLFYKTVASCGTCPSGSWPDYYKDLQLLATGAQYLVSTGLAMTCADRQSLGAAWSVPTAGMTAPLTLQGFLTRVGAHGHSSHRRPQYFCWAPWAAVLWNRSWAAAALCWQSRWAVAPTPLSCFV